YSETSNTNNPNTNNIKVNISNHGLVPDNPVYLVFTNGGAGNGLYQGFFKNSSSSFNVKTLGFQNITSGCFVPKFKPHGYVQNGTNITVDFSGPHGLNPGDPFYVVFTSGTGTNGQYQVATVPDPKRFVFSVTNSLRQTQNAMTVYPLTPPPFVRAGNVAV